MENYSYFSKPFSHYNEFNATLRFFVGDEKIHAETFTNPNSMHEFLIKYCQSRKHWTIVKSALIPVRTNPIGLAKDFFLPTVINRALYVDSFAKKLFAVLFSAGFDVLTFPARLFTVIPRIIYNAFQSEHPLMDYLVKTKNKEKKQLDVEKIRLEIDTSVALVISNIQAIEWVSFKKEDLNSQDIKMRDVARNIVDYIRDSTFRKYVCDPDVVDPFPYFKSLAKINWHENDSIKIVQKEQIQREVRLKTILESSGKVEATFFTNVFINVKDTWYPTTINKSSTCSFPFYKY